MLRLPHILADSETGEILRTLFIVAVVVFALVRRFIRKKDTREADRPAGRQAAVARSESHTPPGLPVQPAEHPTWRTKLPEHSTARSPGPDRAATGLPALRTQAPRARAARPATPVQEGIRTVRDPVDLDTVDEEVEQMQGELEQKDADRQLRMKTAPPAEADTAAIDSRISHFQRMETPIGQAPPVVLDLSNPTAGRMAIVYHEIMSRPKALREEAELWDR